MDNEFEMLADDIFELEIGFAIVNLMMFEDMNYDDARKQAIIDWKEFKFEIKPIEEKGD